MSLSIMNEVGRSLRAAGANGVQRDAGEVNPATGQVKAWQGSDSAQCTHREAGRAAASHGGKGNELRFQRPVRLARIEVSTEAGILRAGVAGGAREEHADASHQDAV